jgi:hypothetical protein
MHQAWFTHPNSSLGSIVQCVRLWKRRHHVFDDRCSRIWRTGDSPRLGRPQFGEPVCCVAATGRGTTVSQPIENWPGHGGGTPEHIRPQHATSEGRSGRGDRTARTAIDDRRWVWAASRTRRLRVRILPGRLNPFAWTVFLLTGIPLRPRGHTAVVTVASELIRQDAN